MTDNKEKKTRVYLLCALIFLLGAIASVLFLLSDIGLTKINVSEYLLISMEEDGTYSFSVDTHRIKKTFRFPEARSMPENRALDSLSLIVSASGTGTRFEVGSYLDNARALLKEGGYMLSNTVWSWTQEQVKQEYAKLLSVPKTISLKDFATYRSDGDGNWSPEIDQDLLARSIGDRLRYDSRLEEAVKSLSLSPTVCADGTLKIETWSSFPTSQGLTVDAVLRSGGVSVKDTVFITDISEILSQSMRPLRLLSYCLMRETGEGAFIEIDKASVLSDLGFSPGSKGAKAVEALELHVQASGDRYVVSVYSKATDLDIIKVLNDNGVELTETEFVIQK